MAAEPSARICHEAPHKEAVMPKGYFIARVDITDPDAYAQYAAAATEAITEAWRQAARARRRVMRRSRAQARARNVVLEFESYDAARTYYHSEEYQAAKANARRRGGDRNACSSREFDDAEGLLDRPCRRAPIPRATRTMSRPTPPPSPNTAARFLVRAGKHETKAGSVGARQVVIEFKDYETALACSRIRRNISGRRSCATRPASSIS